MATKTEITEVPLLNLNAQYEYIKDEIKEAIDRVLESQYFIMGPEVESFEKQVADYCNSKYAIGCASGSDALLLSLMALDIGPGDAVITTPYTFFATAGAISRLGATPVFLDINPRSYNLDPGQVEDFLSGNHPLNSKLDIWSDDVKAMIPVHLYGQMADMDPIMNLSQEYEISVIEDAAQAIGSEYKGRRAGSIGDFGCFSFFPSKNLGGYGDGGLVTTNDPDMAEKLDVLRRHGSKPKYHHRMVGINSRLDAIQAAVLKVKLKYLDGWSEQRREKALTYNRLFKEAGLMGNIEKKSDEKQWANGDANDLDKKVFLPQEIYGSPEANGRHIYHQYVIRTGMRQKIMEALDANNIGHSIYYPVSLHEQKCFAYIGYEAADCPESHNASNTTLALPVYPELTKEQQQYVVETIDETLNS
jgi:dTDP-4-amino-4,6-dideoxygalactose transaminase